METRATVRVLIVDDEPLIRSGFRFTLAADPSIEVIGEASDGAAAIELVRQHRPDVVLMDVRMPGIGGIDATTAIVAQTDAAVLAITSIDADQQLIRMLAAGASGYMLKDEPPGRIIDAVHRTARGDAILSSRSAARLIHHAVAGDAGLHRQNAADLIGTLTQREREVAAGVARGETNQEIGSALHISAGTVKSHLEQVFIKLRARNRVQVGVTFAQAGLL